MALDTNAYKYKVGDKVKKITAEAVYEITDIQTTSTGYGNGTHYRLTSTVSGCKDRPYWISQFRLYDQYIPASPALRVLFDNRGSEATIDPRVAHEKELARIRGLGGD